MSTKQDDPLSELVTSDSKATDRRKLADLLKPFVEIDGTTKEFSFLAQFDELENNDEKIELVLAAAKARALIFNAEDGMLPKEIIELGVMPAGSVKTSIRRLQGEHKIKKNKSERYVLPPYRVPEMLKKLRGEA